MYYFIVVDKILKNVFIVNADSCISKTRDRIGVKYNMNNQNDLMYRFSLFSTNNKNLESLPAKYKKYTKIDVTL